MINERGDRRCANITIPYEYTFLESIKRAGDKPTTDRRRSASTNDTRQLKFDRLQMCETEKRTSQNWQKIRTINWLKRIRIHVGTYVTFHAEVGSILPIYRMKNERDQCVSQKKSREKLGLIVKSTQWTLFYGKSAYECGCLIFSSLITIIAQ